jgi:hypothetical protein
MIHFNFILPSISLSSNLLLFFQAAQPKACINFSSSPYTLHSQPSAPPSQKKSQSSSFA